MTAVADPADPFAETTVDEDFDPFANADDVKSGGVFVPWPGIDAVAGRLIVLVPRRFDKEAKVSDYLQKTYQLPATREEWTTDLVVLDGGDLSYTYQSKVDGSKDEYEEKTHEVAAADLPFLVPNWRVSWANMIGTLNGLAKLATPVGFGHIRAGYSAKEMRAGKTFEDFAAEEEAYYAAIAANPRQTKIDKPKPRWHFVLSKDPADKAKALAWWKAAAASGYKLTEG
jgi:hypothetical protein